VASGGEALAAIRQQCLDAMVLDIRLGDIPAAQLVEEIQAQISPQTPPIVVCGPADPDVSTKTDIRRLTRNSTVRYAESADRLLEEITLLLHRAEADLSQPQRDILNSISRSDTAWPIRRCWW
jgi:DNA-binding response OmpR family regulator